MAATRSIQQAGSFPENIPERARQRVRHVVAQSFLVGLFYRAVKFINGLLEQVIKVLRGGFAFVKPASGHEVFDGNVYCVWTVSADWFIRFGRHNVLLISDVVFSGACSAITDTRRDYGVILKGVN